MGSIIREKRKALGLTLQAVGDAFGITRSAVASWERGDTRPDQDKLPALARLLKTSTAYLLTGEKQHDRAGLYVPFLAAMEASEDVDLPNPTEDEFSMVPQLDIAAACGDGKFVDHVVVKGGLAFKRSSLRDFGVPEHAARIIYASGGSMSPTVQDGCVVLLNTADRTPKDGKIFAICTPDGGLVLKRLIWDYHPTMGAQTWIMRSDNPDKTSHPDKILPPDDRTMIVGRAVWNDNRL
ncbi:XRE family transcriptional regulator [Burkholderia multivorans]|uniref:XRE family transcriptional regulator n=1 Tax=Burkholderia multivorans TaxID=87883 RepID=UPI0021BEC80D|nr:helix-turn-helix domain-containing protein [Burkholderia multivorans]